MEITEQGQKNRDEIQSIRSRMLKGEITHHEALVEATPVIDEMNKRGAEIAKAHGMKYKPLTFFSLMR